MLAHERGAPSMGGAVAITRVDLTAAELRASAGREKDGSAARRMLALALVLDGADRKTAAETCGMDRQTLRDWLHRYNAKGLAGLRNLIKSSGPGSKLTTRQQAELNWPSLSRPVPIRRATGWWVRGESICATKLERRFGVVLTNVQGAPTARRAPYAIPSTYLI